MIPCNTNSSIRGHFSLNQWKDTQNVLDCFEEEPVKELRKFAVFDIREFCLLIKEHLVPKGLDFAKMYVHISKNGKKMVNHARKSLLLNNHKT